MSTNVITRTAIVAEARAWIGTRYRHQASLKGVGCDCLGLVRGVWRGGGGGGPRSRPGRAPGGGGGPQAVPAYAPDWAEARCEETLADAAFRHLVAGERDNFAAGDVLLF